MSTLRCGPFDNGAFLIVFKNAELGRKLFLACHPSLIDSQEVREATNEHDRDCLAALQLIVSEGEYNREVWNRSL